MSEQLGEPVKTFKERAADASYRAWLELIKDNTPIEEPTEEEMDDSIAYLRLDLRFTDPIEDTERYRATKQKLGQILADHDTLVDYTKQRVQDEKIESVVCDERLARYYELKNDVFPHVVATEDEVDETSRGMWADLENEKVGSSMYRLHEYAFTRSFVTVANELARNKRADEQLRKEGYYPPVGQ